MGNRFASGKNSIAECDRCGFRFKLTALQKLVVKTKVYDLKVCPQCWDPDQPQLQLGMYPVDDPQVVRDPRPDLSYQVSGRTGLQVVLTNSPNIDAQGIVGGGSRIFEWGWNPVGGSRANDAGLTPNDLVSVVEVGTVTVSVT
jgi:hypothetical protein